MTFPFTALRYVVHEHHATRLHYDLRLECGGALFDWVVPKGPSLQPLVKRLAIAQPLHPLKCLSAEGIIPDGQYGAGLLRIWDTGVFAVRGYKTYSPDEAFALGHRQGHLRLTLCGRRLKGDWSLQRVKGHWLFIRETDNDIFLWKQ